MDLGPNDKLTSLIIKLRVECRRARDWHTDRTHGWLDWEKWSV